jgi:hypothetical protein
MPEMIVASSFKPLPIVDLLSQIFQLVDARIQLGLGSLDLSRVAREDRQIESLQLIRDRGTQEVPPPLYPPERKSRRA